MSRYVIRNAMLRKSRAWRFPWAGLTGALPTEIVYGYPGVGMLLYNSIIRADYNPDCGITIFSIVGYAKAVLIINNISLV